MKIVRVETIPVSLPVGDFADGHNKVAAIQHPPRFSSGRSHRHAPARDGRVVLSNVIVRIHTDDGLAGTGEAACDTTEPVRNVRNIIDRHMAPLLIGENPLDWEFLVDRISWDAPRGATRFATAGIDLALHDLVGKALEVPVHALIGGYRREKLLASIEVPKNASHLQVEHCVEYFAQGVRGFKLKIGSNPYLDAEAIVGTWEKLGPGISLRADANCGYTVKQARTFCRLVEDSGAQLEVLEQPTAKLDLQGMKAVRDATDIPIEADESAFSLEMVYALLRTGAVDLINTKCAKAAGIKGVREWATVARAADTGVVIGTEWGCAAIVAAKLHLGAALANADPVVELTEIMIHELLHKEPVVLEDGYIRVPTAPGLGMELDDAKIGQFRTPDA